ncbi:MAG: serine hydrolase domain-containing protein [Desulforhopalus sp.]
MKKWSKNVLKKNLDFITSQAMENHVFSACSIGLSISNQSEKESYIFNYGCLGDECGGRPVDDGTFFDLASLTKPLVTSLSLISLLKEDKLRVEDKLSNFFDFHSHDKKKISILNLLTHSSGLPAHRPFFLKLLNIPQKQRMEDVVQWILSENLSFEPGTNNLYSDLGFILLGKIIENITGESLDKYWTKKILSPLDLDDSLFFANKQFKRTPSFVETGTCPWSNKKLCGTVHDDNCRALGGVAGHAGVFGSTRGVLALCDNIEKQFRGERQRQNSDPEYIGKLLSSKYGNWIFGFDTPTAGGSSSGKYFSKQTVGHLGFTGTSFWIDVERGISIVLLTNRVVYENSLLPIKTFRPLLHDTIMKTIIKKPGRITLQPGFFNVKE